MRPFTTDDLEELEARADSTDMLDEDIWNVLLEAAEDMGIVLPDEGLVVHLKLTYTEE